MSDDKDSGEDEPETISSPTELASPDAGFSRKILNTLIVAGVVLFTLAIVLLTGHQRTVHGPISAPPIVSDTSPIGMRAFIDLMTTLGRPVELLDLLSIPQRSDSGSVVLVPALAEPDLAEAIRSRYADARTVVVILPKWAHNDDPDGAPYQLISEKRVASVIEAFDDRITFERSDRRAVPSGNLLRNFPSFPAINKVQTLSGEGFNPLVGDRKSALVAILKTYGERPEIVVVSDPDPFLNHGLDDAQNAQFAVELIDMLRGRVGNIYIDATSGGLLSPPSLWREMFRFPLLAVTLGLFGVFSVLLFAAASEFGDRQHSRVPMRSGRRTVLDASENLLVGADHLPKVLAKYWNQTVLTVARHYRVTDAGDRNKAIRQITHAEAMRGLPGVAAQIELRSNSVGNDINAIRILAREIHRWKTRMLHGR